MATSGSINGTRSGTRPYLRLNWSRIETDVGGNRSKLRLQLYLMHPYRVNYSTTKSGVLQGSSFSTSSRISGTGSTLLRTQEIWVGHNSDGSKTQSLSASYNINITFSSVWLGQLTVSGGAVIDPIPRGSTLSAFSFASSLQIGTANTINYTIARHSGNYRHQFQLRDGSVTIATWDNVSSNGSTTLPLTGAQVNTILGRMSTVTSKSFTLRVATRSGVNGGWIGNAVTRAASVSVNANVTPLINSTSVAPVGNSWAVSRGLYIQGQSGVQAEFSSSARGGAGVRSRNISVGDVNGGSAVGSVFRYIHNVFTGTGDVTITYTITDTRGRSTTATRTINRLAYTPPRISTFDAARSLDDEESVTVTRKGTTDTVGGRNSARLTIAENLGTGGTRTIEYTTFSGNFDDSVSSTVSSGTSATYTLTVTDDLGNTATATVTIGTAFMELSIRKGEGIGVGKIHERGVMDIDGDIYSNGVLYTVGGLGSIEIPARDNLNNYTANGFYHNSLDSETATIANIPENRAFSLLVQKHTGTQQTFTSYGGPTGTNFAQYIRHYYNGSWGQWVRASANTLPRPLWEGSLYMHGTQTATPIKKLSECSKGWMLQWSYFDGSVRDNNFNYTFIPKQHVEAHIGKGLHQIIGTNNSEFKTKYLFANDTRIDGHQNNAGDGIVLRRVYEW